MNVTVYCSSQVDLPPLCEEAALAAAQVIGEHHCNLVYGGVNAGLMHVVAYEASQHGSHIIGIVPETFKQRLDALVDESVLTCDLNGRKSELISRGDLFVVLPGGIGTLDEWMSTLSTIKINSNDNRQIIVANMNGIFNSTIDQLNQIADSPFTTNNRFLNANVIANNLEELKAMLTNAINDYEKK